MACFEILPGRKIGNGQACFIIAEIGQNHQGDTNIAKKMIQAAVECGADCIKFQKSDVASRFNKHALNRPYTSPNSFGSTYGEHRQYLEFSDEEFIDLANYSSHLGIPFTASGMDKIYQQHFANAVIGYSGHEKGIGISIAAVALGAKILERHFTLDHNWKGSDHKASLEPNEFRQLVNEVRNVEAALISSEKILQKCELECYKKLSKTIIAAKHLTSGTLLREDMLNIKVAEPKGWKAENMANLIGRKLLHDVHEDESILEENVL